MEHGMLVHAEELLGQVEPAPPTVDLLDRMATIDRVQWLLGERRDCLDDIELLASFELTSRIEIRGLDEAEKVRDKQVVAPTRWKARFMKPANNHQRRPK